MLLLLPDAKRSPRTAQNQRHGHGEVSWGHGSFRWPVAHGGQRGTCTDVSEQAGKRGHLSKAVQGCTWRVKAVCAWIYGCYGAGSPLQGQ